LIGVKQAWRLCGVRG